MNQRGFTLVEVLTTLAVTSIVITILMTFAMSSLVQFTIAETRAGLLSQMQLALDIANNDIRLSASADENNRYPDANAPGAPGNLYSWESDSNTLVLAKSATDLNGSILFDDPLNYISVKNNIIYFVDSGTLYQRVLASPEDNNSAVTTCPPDDATEACPTDRRLLDDVTDFSVRYLDSQNNEVAPTSARSIELSATTSQERYRRNISVDYTTRMVFRND